jgi:argininosuccinate lyase
MREINVSIDFDRRLAVEDIEASRAHVRMLREQLIINREDAQSILGGLDRIQEEIAENCFNFRISFEDIHMNIEGRLAELIGESAGRLHTARSRNDQVATDFRLWIRNAFDKHDAAVRSLQASLIVQAEANLATYMPGYTHLQVAQPISFAHHLLAYVEMLGRDRSRLRDSRARLNESPLGSAALAGTSFPIDRTMTAEALGFDRPMANSLDGVSDRDFVLDYLASLSILAVHLSRLAEEIVLWCSDGFRFITLSDAFTTGSSIMPQKRNPDAAELVRAKTGRLFGGLIGFLTVLKGLPLAYSKDMQEDKEAVFEAHDTMELMLAAMTGMIADMKANKELMAAAAGRGYSTATDLADYLVQTYQMPFRQTHRIAGQLVKEAEARGCALNELPLEVFQKADNRLTEEVLTMLSVEASVNRRTSQGGTAPIRVAEAIEAAKKKYL